MSCGLTVEKYESHKHNYFYFYYTEKGILRKKLGQILALTTELYTGIPLNPDSDLWKHGNRISDTEISKLQLDEATANLCAKLKTVEVTKYSLEMQIWWRDHQKADRKREGKE